MNNKIKCMCYELVEQLDYYDLDKLKQKLEENKDIVINYAYVIHHEENNIHFHCMLKLSTRLYITDIAKRFDIDIQQINKPKVTGKYQYLYMCQYLIHMNDLTKEQIDPNNVISNFDYVSFIKNTPQEEDRKQKNEDFINDLLEWDKGKLTTYDLCVIYGRDFMKNYKKYMEILQILRADFAEIKEK